MGSCHSLEKALGVFDQIDPPIRVLRNLLYCGEWIESHVLHMFMLHLPDFLGYESAITMAKDHGDIVRRALRIKKCGNDLVALLGGRAVHPVGVCVGGFYKAPTAQAATELLAAVDACLEDMCELSLFLAKQVKYPDLERDYEFVALCPDDEYPMNLGRIRSNKGLDVDQSSFGDAIEERQVAHSTALQATIRGRGDYLVGPLARLNLNHEKLHARAAQVLKETVAAIGKPLPWKNMYLSLPARAVETVHALALASDILHNYRPPARSRIPLVPRAGRGARNGGPARDLLASLSHRSGWDCRRRDDYPADQSEPGECRGGPSSAGRVDPGSLR